MAHREYICLSSVGPGAYCREHLLVYLSEPMGLHLHEHPFSAVVRHQAPPVAPFSVPASRAKPLTYRQCQLACLDLMVLLNVSPHLERHIFHWDTFYSFKINQTEWTDSRLKGGFVIFSGCSLLLRQVANQSLKII